VHPKERQKPLSEIFYERYLNGMDEMARRGASPIHCQLISFDSFKTLSRDSQRFLAQTSHPSFDDSGLFSGCPKKGSF